MNYCTKCNPNKELKKFELPCGWLLPLYIEENETIHNPNCEVLNNDHSRFIREYPCKYIPNNETGQCENYSTCKLVKFI